MVGLLLFVIALALVARGWIAGRSEDPARVRALLVRLPLAILALLALLAAATRATGVAATALSVAAAAVALVAFEALAGLALWGRPGRALFITRAVFAVVAFILVLAHGPRDVLAFFVFLAFLSFRWRRALGTRELFVAFLGASVLFTVLVLDLPGTKGRLPAGPIGGAHAFARVVLSVMRWGALFGIFKTFAAFTRDPSLGIRTVTRRLALSHVLVLLVPLLITLTLWVSTTYLGVNGDRALAGRRLLENESEALATSLRSVVLAGDRAAAERLAADRGRRWPGIRLWLDQGQGLERVVGDSIPSEARLGSWVAGLDTLPDHGAIGLRARRWLGAAARGTGAVRAVVMVAPIRSVFDSTLSPVLGARYSMRENDPEELAAALDSAGVSLDSLTALARDVKAMRGAGRRPAVRNRPQVHLTKPPGAPLMVGTSTERDSFSTAEAIAFSGMAIVPGPEATRTRWRRGEFMMTARADLKSTLAGLYANVMENPLQVVPIIMLALIVLLLLPVAIVDFSMVGGMGRSIAQAIGALRDGAQALGRGELGHRIVIAGDDDLWDTARQFNRMAEGLEQARALEQERQRLENELELARRIQKRLLPAEPPAVPGLEIAGHSEPAREVGGDYYDHFDLGGGRVLLVIADVSGKGVPAALLMSGFRASLMSQDANVLAPARLAERVNEFLHRSVESGKFVTAFLGFLDAPSGRLVYANAGHNPPALLRADGSVEWLAAGGLVLGIMADTRFESGEATLAPGDLLALYTDGVTEGADATGDMWGEERLVAALHRLHGEPCAAAAEALVREVRTFEGDTGPADDITVLLARRV